MHDGDRGVAREYGRPPH